MSNKPSEEEVPDSSSGGSGSKSSGKSKVTQLHLERVSRVEARVEEVVDSESPSVSQGQAHLLVADDGVASSNSSNSESPADSAERGDIVQDKNTVWALIEAYEKKKDVDQYWYAFDLIPEERLRALATNENYDRSSDDYQRRFTLLHGAARLGLTELAKLLLEHGSEKFVDKYAWNSVEDRVKTHTPLTFAVVCCSRETIKLLLKYSEHRADALCTAIQYYEAETNVKHRAERKGVIDWLLEQPEIVGGHNVKPKTKDEVKGCLNEPDQLKSFRILQWICFYRDSWYFDIIKDKLPDREDGGYYEHLQLAENNDTILHLAVNGAQDDTDHDAAFVRKLLETYKDLGPILNYDNKTALSLACEKGRTKIIIALAESGVKLWPKGGRQYQEGISPLHAAVAEAKNDLVALLLERWSEDAKGLLEDEAQLKSLINRAMNPWRAKVLLKEKDKDQVDVIKKLLKFDLGRKIFEYQLKAAIDAIKKVNDSEIQKPLSKMWAQVSSDYQLIRDDVSDGAIEQKIKFLGLANALQRVSEKYSLKISEGAQTKEEAKNEFVQCCRHLLYSNKMKTVFGVAVCAFIGLCVGALVGFIVGTLLSGGGPGGFALGPPSAEYGMTLGIILGCAIFGIGVGTGRYLLSDFFKWQRGLWASTKAMEKNINSSGVVTSDLIVRSIESGPRSGDRSQHDLDVEHTEDSYGVKSAY